MTLGDVYGKVNRSGNDAHGRPLHRSSEDGSDASVVKKTSPTALILAQKRLDKQMIEKQIIDFHREILSADLHKKDNVSFLETKKDLDTKIKTLDQSKRRLNDEIRRLESSVNIEEKRYM